MKKLWPGNHTTQNLFFIEILRADVIKFKSLD